MKHILRKFSQGSILAYSLVLLGIVLVASIGMMAASVTNLRSVSSNDKSINAFQIADSGSQAVIKMLKSAGGSDLGDVTGVTCSGSDAVVESGAFLGGSYKVTFLNSDGETMKCSGAKGKIADVTSVKSVGTYVDTARAVQVAVAAGACPDSGGWVLVDESSNENGFDISKVENFLNAKARTFSFACWSAAGIASVVDGTGIAIKPSDFAHFTGSMQCVASNGKCYEGASPCYGGWRIYADCPVKP